MAIAIGARNALIRRLNSNKSATAVTAITIAAITAAVFSPLYYEFPAIGDSSVMSFENGVAIEHPFGTFCWNRCINVPDTVLVKAGVTSLTFNPKVRKINYEVSVEIFWPERFYRHESRQKLSAWSSEWRLPISSCNNGPWQAYKMDDDYRKSDCGSAEVAKVVLNQLFKFNAAHSAELVGFDNPLDPEQNRRLGEMLEGAIGPALAEEGLRVTFERFTVE
ncbi:MAG: hypothetical protein HY395_02195 [Candidatus Doudnabacteria bacterium]|nr:hypothetical protein [Candidatus Doudnabacteria bacterium]